MSAGFGNRGAVASGAARPATDGGRRSRRFEGLELGVWPVARSRVAGLAMFVAVLTATGLGALATSGWQVLGAVAYVAVAMVGLVVPGAIGVGVLGGVGLAGSLLLGPGAGFPGAGAFGTARAAGSILGPGMPPVLLLPIVAGVVATAELLALSGQLDSAVPRDVVAELRRAGAATGIAAAVYAVVALIGALPGPTGFLAVVIAAAAGLGLAVLLMRAG